MALLLAYNFIVKTVNPISIQHPSDNNAGPYFRWSRVILWCDDIDAVQSNIFQRVRYNYKWKH
jgi:hypothetical protein